MVCCFKLLNSTSYLVNFLQAWNFSEKAVAKLSHLKITLQYLVLEWRPPFPHWSEVFLHSLQKSPIQNQSAGKMDTRGHNCKIRRTNQHKIHGAKSINKINRLFKNKFLTKENKSKLSKVIWHIKTRLYFLLMILYTNINSIKKWELFFKNYLNIYNISSMWFL